MGMAGPTGSSLKMKVPEAHLLARETAAEAAISRTPLNCGYNTDETVHRFLTREDLFWFQPGAGGDSLRRPTVLMFYVYENATQEVFESYIRITFLSARKMSLKISAPLGRGRVRPRSTVLFRSSCFCECRSPKIARLRQL